MKVFFVLVEPAVPENIGAAARSLKTMGFKNLRLVNPANHLADEARWLAHGSNDILESAVVFQSLEGCLKDVDFTIGTTAKRRSVKADYYSPEQALELVLKKDNTIKNLAIVFGREESGLTNEELRLCDVVSSIPIDNPYPSINLAQSVMIYAYVFCSLKLTNAKIDSDEEAKSNRAYSEIKTIAVDIFKELELDRNENLFHRMLERIASASADDLRLMLSFAKKYKQKFDKN